MSFAIKLRIANSVLKKYMKITKQELFTTHFFNKGEKLWGGRFSEETDKVLEKLNASIDYDKRMWREDIKGSEAYANALKKAGLLTKEELMDIHNGFQQIKEEWHTDTFVIKNGDEDIHTANERRLKELIGQPAMKLHTGRSRNDQAATDTRMWLREKINTLNTQICELIEVLVERASAEVEIIIPGYTHLQKAQPVRWSHWLLSYAWFLVSDSERLTQMSHRVNVMPLGSGALAGNPFRIDRQSLAEELKFEKCSSNSMNAVRDRDFVAEFLFWASLNSIHLSQLAEDLILFSSQEFSYVTLADAYTTGSSLMPQKKNPDSLELVRGISGRILGHCTGFMTTLKGLPSTYNKDLQEDKYALFNVFDSILPVLKVLTGTVRTLKVCSKKCMDGLTSEMLATDLAYYLVNKGLAFRDAHHVVGEVVALAETLNTSVSKLTLVQLKCISKYFEADVMNVWDYNHSVEQYQATGGTSTSSIMTQIEEMKKWLLGINMVKHSK